MINHARTILLNQAAQENECAVVYIMHFTKDGSERGSANWGHAVDLTMRFDKLDIQEYGENCRQITVDKNRLGAQAEVILKLTREGFDFTAPLENHTQGNDCNKGQGIYINRKLQDNKAIMIRIREKSASGAKLQDFGDLDIDMGRIERLLKELANRGKVARTGGGKGQSKDTIRYFLGDTEPSDFGEADE